MNLGQLRTAIAEELGMNATDDLIKINRWINDAIRDISFETAINVDKASMTLTSGTADYTFSTSILRTLKVYGTVDADGHELERLTLDDLISRQQIDTAVSSPAKYYAVRGRSIFLYPTPGSNETLKLVYVPRPTELSADADDPSTISFGGIPVEHHYAIECYALWRAAKFDDDLSSQIGQNYLLDYQRELSKIRRNLRRNGGDRNPRLFVNTRRNRRAYPTDNSATVW